jgi:hypothetical protein
MAKKRHYEHLRGWCSASYDPVTGHAASSLVDEYESGGYAPGRGSGQVEQVHTGGEAGAPGFDWRSKNCTTKHKSSYAPQDPGLGTRSRDHDGSNNRDRKAGGY